MFVTDSRLDDETDNSQSLKVTKRSSSSTRASAVGPKSSKSSSLSGKKLFSPFEDLNHILKGLQMRAVMIVSMLPL